MEVWCVCCQSIAPCWTPKASPLCYGCGTGLCDEFTASDGTKTRKEEACSKSGLRRG